MFQYGRDDDVVVHYFVAVVEAFVVVVVVVVVLIVLLLLLGGLLELAEVVVVVVVVVVFVVVAFVVVVLLLLLLLLGLVLPGNTELLLLEAVLTDLVIHLVKVEGRSTAILSIRPRTANKVGNQFKVVVTNTNEKEGHYLFQYQGKKWWRHLLPD